MKRSRDCRGARRALHVYAGLAALTAAAVSAPAQDLHPILGTEHRHHLVQALDCLNMTTNDLGFDKDVGKPEFVLPRARGMLSNPLDLPALGGEMFAACETNDAAALWSLAASLLDAAPLSLQDTTESAGAPLPGEGLSPALVPALTRFYAAMQRASARVDRAFGVVPPTNREYAVAAFLVDAFAVEDHPEVRPAILAAGVSSGMVDRALQESLEVDPKPAALRQLAMDTAVDMPSLLAAGRMVRDALAELQRQATNGAAWPRQPLRLPTPLGDIWIGTTADDTYTNAALLILEPAGNDTYRGDAGTANGLKDARVGAILDLRGDDLYDSDGMIGAGAALFGIAAVVDADGNDTYRAAYIGQGAALFGVAFLEDQAGDDDYKAHGLAQGAAAVGFGLLRDEDGNDLYSVGFYGQGFAGIRAVGVLCDRAGNDRYIAGGRKPDIERHDDRYLSLSQGFSIGNRPYAGGGFAALVDLAGNDIYDADIYGQGSAYWYSVGMLLDRAGNDSYRVYHYGQGSGIHLAAGLLVDGAGNDLYTGYILTQGNAHDYAVGMLIDLAGDDTYSADSLSQGRGMNNALGLLLDASGNDAYFARQNGNCQGIGDDGAYREYGSLCLLLDLGGHDSYSCGARDGARFLRPSYGIVYDVKEAAPHE